VEFRKNTVEFVVSSGGAVAAEDLFAFVDDQGRVGDVSGLDADLRVDAPRQLLLECLAVRASQRELTLVAHVRLEYLRSAVMSTSPRLARPDQGCI